MKKFRKISSALLAAGILTTSLPVYSAAAAVGDLNGDGKIDEADAERFAQYFAGWTMDEETKADILAAGDVNGDEDVTRADAMELARSVEGWDGFTPMEEKIYTKSLEAEHVQTSELTYNGETYEGMYVDNEIIVIIDEDSVDRAYVESLAEEYDGEVVGQIPTVGFYQVLFETAMTAEKLEEICEEIKLREYVEDAYLNTVFEYDTSAYYPDDPFDLSETGTPLEELWNSSMYTWHLRATNVPGAWELVKKQNPNPSIKIGILDGLFDVDHPDLTNMTIQHYADKDITASKYPDYAAHGTHVAGIIGADINNAKGVAGVALGAELIGRTIHNGSFWGKEEDGSIVLKATRTTFATWVDDIISLIESDCKIINMSLGGVGSNTSIEKNSDELEKRLLDLVSDQKDFLLVVSAGNKGEKIDHDVNYNSIVTKIDNPLLTRRIIVVGNATCGDVEESDVEDFCYFSEGFERTANSSYIGGRVDVMAPGTAIYSTIPMTAEHPDDSYNIKHYAGYAYMSGTSMASPLVAGVAALVWEANPNLTPEMVKYILQYTADIPVDGNGDDDCPKMVNAEAAVKKAISLKYVSGHIISKETGKAIPGAKAVLFNDTSFTTVEFTADDNGYIKGFTDSSQVFTKARISADGYDPKTVEINYSVNEYYSLSEVKLDNATKFSVYATFDIKINKPYNKPYVYNYPSVNVLVDGPETFVFTLRPGSTITSSTFKENRRFTYMPNGDYSISVYATGYSVTPEKYDFTVNGSDINIGTLYFELTHPDA